MSFLKTKIISLWRQVKNTRLSFRILKRKKKLDKQIDLDKKLVYSLSPKKIPDAKQLKHLGKFLDKKEILLVRVLVLIFIVSISFLVFSFFNKKIISLPRPGGNYTEAVVAYPKNINPLYSGSREVDSDISRLIYSSLFRYNKEGELEQDLVEFFEVTDDGKEYLIKIKDNVSWHDQGFLTADDVLFTFNLIKDESYRSPLRPAFVGVEAEKVGDLFIKFKLNEARSPFLSFLTFGIAPKYLWENTNPDSIILSELNLKAIGSGPFKFKSISKTKSGEIRDYVLEANNNYYGGAPYIKTFKFIFFPDRQESIKALNDKRVLAISSLPFFQKESLLAKNSLYIRDLIQPQIVSLFFNEDKNTALKDKDLRIALAKAINKEELINNTFNSSYYLADGPFLKVSPAYNQEAITHSFSLQEATDFFKDKELKIEITVVDAVNNLTLAEKIKDYWQAVGVQVELRVVTGEQIIEIIKERNFQVLIYGQAVGGDPDIYAFWHSSQIKNGSNLTGYKNESVDKLLLDARSESSEEERINKYKEVHKIIADDMPVIFLYSPAYSYIQSKDINGFSGTALINPSDRFSDINKWYLKTTKKINW